MKQQFADAHCDFLYKCLSGACFDTPQEGLAICNKNIVNSGTRLLGLAAFCGDENDRKTMHKNVLEQIKAYYNLTKPANNGRFRKLPAEAFTYLTLEGMDYISKLSDLEEFLSYDISACGLMWNRENDLGGSAYYDKPLTALGKAVALALDKNGIKIDLAHAGVKTFFDLCNIIEKPFISHGNVYDICSHVRNYTKEQIRIIIQRQTFIGLTFYTEFVGSSKDIEAFYQHLDYILQMGGEKVVGIGSDFDGCSSTIKGIDSPADFYIIYDYLLKKNISEAVIDAICYKNLANYLNFQPK